MTEHRNLTGDSLHEPKGIETATAGQVYVSNGLGSGVWTDRHGGILNLNKFSLVTTIDDVSETQSSFTVVPVKAQLNKVVGVLDGPLTVANAVLTVYKNGVSQSQTITLPYADSAAGTKVSQSFSPVISLNEGDVVELRSDGASTSSTGFHATLFFTSVS